MSNVAHCDLLVIGAGPAGLAAATQAANLGVDTALLDEQPAPGGQIYRAVTSTPVQDRSILGPDYWHGHSLLKPFEQSGARYLPRSTVWAINRSEPDRFEVAFSTDGQAQLLHPRYVLLATGAQERPFPIPGWTLPGVITAGAAQILLKSSGVVPTGRTVLAGSGPLLYLIAWQYLNAGVPIEAILETTPRDRWRKALPHAWGFLRSPYLFKGMKLLRAVQAAVPVIRGVSRLEALGARQVEQVRFTAASKEQVLPVDQLLLHQGVVPNVNLSRALGVEHVWSDRQACWEPHVDVWGATSVAHVGIAGDGAGIAGAMAAEHRGRLVALHAARALGKIDEARRDREAGTPRTALARAVRGREFFETLYQAPVQFRRPVGATIVCRCEEVTAAQVRETARMGCPGPNQMKGFLRCGMGPCQGRLCGLTVTELIAEEAGRRPQDVGYYRLRFPTKPLPLGELATLPQTQASKDAVVRFKK